MDTVYTALVFPLLLLIGQTLVALGQRKISQRMDEGQAKTDAVCCGQLTIVQTA